MSKEVKSAARTPFADPTFLHAIGTTFLERVAKNSTPRLDEIEENESYRLITDV